MAVDSTRCPPNINSRHNALNSYHHSGHPSFPRSKSLNLSQRQSNRQPVPRLVYPQVHFEQSPPSFFFFPFLGYASRPPNTRISSRKTAKEKRTFPLERSDSIVHCETTRAFLRKKSVLEFNEIYTHNYNTKRNKIA